MERLSVLALFVFADLFSVRLFSLSLSTQIDETAILAMISSQTLVGVLPVPHPIVVRKYIPNHFTNLWFSTFLTGIIFLRQQALSNLSYGISARAPLWNGQAVKMFVISNAGTHEAAEQERKQREADVQRQTHSQPAANTQQTQQQTQQPAPGQSLAQSQQQPPQQQPQQQQPQLAPQPAASSSSAVPPQQQVQQTVV